jgi:excisionase family DNA binding protein
VSLEATVSGLPVQQVERYVTRRELAELMHVGLSTIDAMVKEGMPSVTWGRRTRRFRASTAIAWAQERQAA